jgi:hypothetical protein
VHIVRDCDLIPSPGRYPPQVGLVALDDVFRVHAQTVQRAMAVGPRMAGLMDCNVTSPPTIELSDPNLALRKSGDTYVQEWAIYPFFEARGVDASGQGQAATDYFSFVNAQRHDMGSARLIMHRTGFLGPASSSRGDLSVYSDSGYDQCYNKTLLNPNAEPKPRATAKTCWESWDAPTFLDFIQKQSGPGGMIHISNGDMLYDKPDGCGQITIDGNRFVDPKQRPADFDMYFAQVVNQTRAANALLPAGAPQHKVVLCETWHACIHTHIHTYTHIHIHTYTHTHIYTYTDIRPRPPAVEPVALR